MRMTLRFDEIKIKAVRRWEDETGRKRQQTKTFMQTLNPFNRNRDGTVKDREQILRELQAQRIAWLNERPPNDRDN